MPNKSISTLSTDTPLTGSTLLAVSTGPCSVFAIEGYCSGGSGQVFYLQLLGTATPTSTTTVPLFSRPIFGASGFSFTYDDEPLDTSNMYIAGNPNTSNNLPVYAAISSTDNVWTSTATSTDCTVVINQEKIDPLNETAVGPSATVDSLSVYTDPNPALRMTRFSVTNNSGATAYIMLFPYANPVAGSVPLQQWTVANGATFSPSFGPIGTEIEGGKSILNPGSTSPPTFIDYSLHTGCYLYGSSTTQSLTATTGGQWTMSAWYITNQ